MNIDEFLEKEFGNYPETPSHVLTYYLTNSNSITSKNLVQEIQALSLDCGVEYSFENEDKIAAFIDKVDEKVFKSGKYNFMDIVVKDNELLRQDTSIVWLAEHGAFDEFEKAISEIDESRKRDIEKTLMGKCQSYLFGEDGGKQLGRIERCLTIMDNIEFEKEREEFIHPKVENDFEK